MGDDAELLRRAGQGEQSAWDCLVARYGNKVWAVARAFRLSRADAQDVFQTTWLNLVTHLDRIQEPDRVGAWLATTARNECLGALRRSARQVPSGDQTDLANSDQASAADGVAVDSRMLASERQAELWQAIGGLPERCQRLLRVLLADPAPSYDEVSTLLDMPIGSIGPTRARCLQNLRVSLVGITGDTEDLHSRGST